MIFPVFGRQRYPSIPDKAAASCCALARGRVFQDGNKRTVLEASWQFLEINGWRIGAEYAVLVDLMVDVAQGETSRQAHAEWFRYNTVPR